MNRTAAVEALMVTGARIAFVGFWFVAILLIYRGLGHNADGLREAGLFAVAIAIIKMASGIISDPVDLAVMRRVPSLLNDQPARAYEILRAAFAIRLCAALAIIAGIEIFAPSLAWRALGNPDVVAFVHYVCIAIFCEMLFRAALVVLQAEERFRTFVVVEGSLSIGRFLAIAAIWASGRMSVDLVLGSYALVALMVAVVVPALMPRDLIATVKCRADDLLDHISYLRWMMPAMVLAAVNERLDIFVVSTFTGAENAGLYGAALTLALVPDIVAGCLSTVLQPKIVRMRDSGVFSRIVRRFLMVSVPICGVGLVAAILLANPVLGFVLGSKYLPAIPAFLWLLAGTLTWLAITPLPMTLVAVTAPRRIALITLAQSCIVLVGGFVLVPMFGWLVMAQVVCGMRISVALALLFSATNLRAVTDEGAAPMVPAS